MQPESLETLRLTPDRDILHVTLNRPKSRNAMSLQMVRELQQVFDSAESSGEYRAVVLRGAEGHFCAGGDIRDMANARAALGSASEDPFRSLNREFGRMITRVNHSPLTVVAVLEGAVLGGGFGLACVSDVAITHAKAKFGLPETGLGIPPAQIAPFVVKRIGLTNARRLALLGARFDGSEALRLGIAHACHDDETLEEALRETLEQLRRCAPGANAITKLLLLQAADCRNGAELDALLDQAADDFARSVQGDEGQEGTMAFMQKRLPRWAE